MQRTTKSALVLCTVAATLAAAGTAAAGSRSAEGEGHHIRMRVHGLKDTACILGNYYGDKQYVQDTVAVDSKGNFEFRGSEPLPGGIYLAILPGKKYFEFIVTGQEFYMETDTAGLVKHMKVKGSADNELFYSYLKTMETLQSAASPLQKEMERVKEEGGDGKDVREKLDSVYREMHRFKEQFVADHPEAFISKVFLASKDPEVPEPPLLENGRPDSTFRYRYYKEHFFDNMDFSDDRMLRTPVFHKRLETYLEKLTVQMPDSINREADYLVSKARANKEMYKYIVHYITNTYERSKYMGMDAVFVHMALNYYTKEDATWVSEAQLVRIRDRATTLNRLLIGKQAPPLVLKDTSGTYRSLYDVKAKYTVLYFWDPDCGHCKKATPKLKEMYRSIKEKDVEVYAVCTETEAEKWRKYIKENALEWINVADIELHNHFRSIYDISSTPKIFILDDKKVIVAKQLDVEQIEEVLSRELGELQH